MNVNGTETTQKIKNERFHIVLGVLGVGFKSCLSSAWLERIIIVCYAVCL